MHKHKFGHSTALCIYALVEIIEYLNSCLNLFYAVFLDAKKVLL